MKSVSLPEKVFAFTQENALFFAPCHALVAVSGGPDSMALLHLLQHWPQPGLTLSVAHLNHGLRGANAARDEAFVRAYCSRHRLALTVYTEDVAGFAAGAHRSLEEAGRMLRYQRFEALRTEIGADVLLTAHTASDQVETVLMHLMRGCGIDGLCGIPAARDAIRRPLLCCRREEILAYCRQHQVPFVIDETNDDARYTRNRVRNELIPLMQSIQPAADQALLRLADHAKEETAFLNARAQKQLDRLTQKDGTAAPALLALEPPLRRRILRALLRRAGVPSVEQVHLLAIEHILGQPSGAVRLPGGVTAQVFDGVLSFGPTDRPPCDTPTDVPIDRLPFTCSTNGHAVTLTALQPPPAENVHKLFVNRAIDCATIVGRLWIRTRREGDTICPAKRGVRKSIKKWMNEWRIPANQRDAMPLLCDDEGVLLVPGYACAARAALSPQSERILLWSDNTPPHHPSKE